MSTRAMNLSELLALFPGARLEGDATTTFSGLAYDSRRVEAGDLFFAVPGFDRDGTAFVEDAVRCGAVAVVAQGPVSAPVPRLLVPGVREAMGRVAARFNGYPSRELLSAGVTGTNGKTTTATLIAGAQEAAGLPTGFLGTSGYRIGSETESAARTTPEAIDLQRHLRSMLDRGAKAVALEISSHAVVLGRIIGLSADAMVFTNLSRDHLDFHGSLEAYYQAKRRLFLRDELAALDARVGRAVINIDDAYGRRLATETDLPLVTFGESDAADVRLEVRESAFAGSRLGFRTARGEFDAWLPLPGAFNARNALAALAAAEALDLPPDAAPNALENARPVPGRFEPIDNDSGLVIIVDFAHTPEGLRELLAAARPFVTGRLITLFGCGGDRDRGKRPLMGRAVAEAADLVVLTSDNPRREDPEAIIADAEPGVREIGTPCVVKLDRREAIAWALGEAKSGDGIVLAGKGDEAYQDFGEHRVEFRDADVVRELLGARSGGGGGRRERSG